jgi:hypothetical protein
MRVLARARTVPEVVAALSILAPAVQTAERFATNIARVETGPARQFRSMAESARRAVDYHRQGVGTVPVPLLWVRSV